MRLWCLSHRRPAKTQVSLHICADSPEPSLIAHIKYGSRRRVQPKIRHLAPLDGCVCTFEEWVTENEKSHNLMRWLKCELILQQTLKIKWYLFSLKKIGHTFISIRANVWQNCTRSGNWYNSTLTNVLYYTKFVKHQNFKTIKWLWTFIWNF